MSTLPFDYIPELIVTNLVYFVVMWMNAFSEKNGCSKKYSPRSIVIRSDLDWNKHCRVLFGSYYEVHDEPDPTNTMKPRTHEAIAV